MPVVVVDGAPTTVTEGTATANGVTLTVSSDSLLARMFFDVEGGPAGQPLYIVRRDRNGSSQVRETSGGTILWVAGAPTTAPRMYDYEARQGLETDYTLTDLDAPACPRHSRWRRRAGPSMTSRRAVRAQSPGTA